MTIGIAVLIGGAILALLANVTFFGSVVYIAKVFSHVIAAVLFVLTALGILKAFRPQKKVVVHDRPTQGPA